MDLQSFAKEIGNNSGISSSSSGKQLLFCVLKQQITKYQHALSGVIKRLTWSKTICNQSIQGITTRIV